MYNTPDLFLTVTYAIVFLLTFLIAIIIFIVKSRNNRIELEEKNKEVEVIANQKTVLLKEMHHRVKNNLQLISGLLYLQSVKHKNVEVKTMIDESQKHINSIALVHEMLYKDETLSLVSMKKYFKELGSRLLQIPSQASISYKLSITEVSLSVDYATTLGLLFNELITNSLKYAFTATQNGAISVSLKEVGINEYLFTYADDGKGYDLDMTNTNKTLGQRLIKMLAEEIEANLTIKNENGLSYVFSFKTKME